MASRGNDGDAKKNAKKNAEKMKMVRRRRERLMRHLRRRRPTEKKKDSESESESFTSDSSDEEMKIAKEQVKRLMEKAIRDDEVEDFKAEEVNIAAAKTEDFKAEDETMFPRRRGRLIRYLRRQRSESQDSAFQIEFRNYFIRFNIAIPD